MKPVGHQSRWHKLPQAWWFISGPQYERTCLGASAIHSETSVLIISQTYSNSFVLGLGHGSLTTIDRSMVQVVVHRVWPWPSFVDDI